MENGKLEKIFSNDNNRENELLVALKIIIPSTNKESLDISILEKKVNFKKENLIKQQVYTPLNNSKNLFLKDVMINIKDLPKEYGFLKKDIIKKEEKEREIS